MGKSTMDRLPVQMEEQMQRALSVDQLCRADNLFQNAPYLLYHKTTSNKRICTLHQPLFPITITMLLLRQGRPLQL